MIPLAFLTGDHFIETILLAMALGLLAGHLIGRYVLREIRKDGRL